MRRRVLLFTLLLTLLACSVGQRTALWTDYARTALMPSQYNGLSGNIVQTSPTNIASMSGNGVNPIIVACSAAHGLTTGDAVDVYGCDGNTAANGTWPSITVTDSTHFTIPTTGNGTYTGVPGGKVQSLADGATFQIPSDGDPLTAASVDVALETLGDRTAHLFAKTGALKLVNLLSFPLTDGGGPLTTTQWTISIGAGSNAFNLASTKLQTISTAPQLQSGDILDVDFQCTANFSASSQLLILGLAAVFYAPNATPGAATLIPGADYAMQVGSSGKAGWRLSGQITVPANTGLVDLYVGANGLSQAGATTVSVFKESQLTVKVWRQTGVLQ